MAENVDVTVFGATGYSGQLALAYLECVVCVCVCVCGADTR